MKSPTAAAVRAIRACRASAPFSAISTAVPADARVFDEAPAQWLLLPPATGAFRALAAPSGERQRLFDAPAHAIQTIAAKEKNIDKE
jgi:alpha-ketoglutarate-dependent taurine dioxygenase